MSFFGDGLGSSNLVIIEIVEGILNGVVKILKKKLLGRQLREKFIGSVALREPHNFFFGLSIRHQSKHI